MFFTGGSAGRLLNTIQIIETIAVWFMEIVFYFVAVAVVLFVVLPRVILLVYEKTRIGRAYTLGRPHSIMRLWAHQTGNTCAINAQRLVLNYLGFNVSEPEMVRSQQAYGYYEPKDGSISQHFLLEAYGVGFKRYMRGINHFSAKRGNAKLLRFLWWSFLFNRLVIASVNSDLLNATIDLASPEFNPAERPVVDHSIVLTGMGVDDRGLVIYYTDTGHPEGNLMSKKAHDLMKIMGDEYVVVPTLFRRSF